MCDFAKSLQTMREQVVPQDAMFYQTTSGAAHTQTMLGLAGGDGDVQAHDGNQKYEDLYLPLQSQT